jgi:hypothetical protein
MQCTTLSFFSMPIKRWKPWDHWLERAPVLLKELSKGSLDEMRQHIQTLAEFAENYLTREQTSEQVSESLEETARAITFTQNFFVAVAFFPYVVLRFAVNGAPAIAILLLIGYIGGLAYLFRDSGKLTSIYWQKTFRFFVTELWSRSAKTQETQLVRFECRLIFTGLNPD